ncbi:hypothetical protein C2I36_15060 [Rhodobacteraceae bacterium WD3A24]|nr:hypothetical protein C2I36_15060 [Rhodobacteraceae bacterium WD3A24]
MGGSSKQVVGYKYFLGAHMVICHGPVDAIREIRVDEKVAWTATEVQASLGSGGEDATPLEIGTVTDMAATAGATSSDPAEVTFPGRLAGVHLETDYALETTAGFRTIRISSIDYDPVADETTWEVTPPTTAFAAQEVTVWENPDAPQNAGAAGGRIRIDKPKLFGGKKREGGIKGNVDIMMGAPDQGPNDYLAAQAGETVPSYRGVTSVVLRQCYLGNNPYLKPWSFRTTRVMNAARGTQQWYPAKAPITPEAVVENAAIYIALDASGSMSGSRMQAAIDAISQLIGEIAENANPELPNDLRLLTWADSVQSVIEKRDADAADYADIQTWIDALPTSVSGGTDFKVALDSAPEFFDLPETHWLFIGIGSALGFDVEGTDKRRVVIFVTDGQPSDGTLDGALQQVAYLRGTEIYAFNIAEPDTTYTAQIDNTPMDGVPVVTSGATDELVASMRNAFGEGPDMNPAHILRECLTNPDWGLGAQDADIGTSFSAAADTLFSEGFGISLIWQQDSSIEDFMSEILDHIDATLYVDLRTGLWETKLIRADYTPASLPVFDETSVVEWGELKRPEAGDQVNSVTVRYTDTIEDKTGAVTVTDTALVQRLGEVVATTLEYPGIRYQGLAVRVAERDLRALSSPLLSGEVVLHRSADTLRPGDVIALDSPRRGLDKLPMRVSEIDRGDGRNNGIRVKVTEDVFALGGTALVGGRMDAGPAIAGAPRKVTRRHVAEATYWHLVQEIGHAQADTILDDDPDAAALVAAGEAPTPDTITAELWVNPGTGYADEGDVSIVPVAVLDLDLSDDPTETDVTVSDWNSIDEAPTGALCALGNELVRLDGAGGNAVVLDRGCLDTVPQAHAAGTVLYVLDEAGISSVSEFSAGDAIDVRMLPETGRGTLPLPLAPADSLSFEGRAVLPLPVGAAKADGAYSIDREALLSADVTLSWAHRDRIAQTGPLIDAYTAGDIGPEPGVSYSVEVYWVDPGTQEPITPPETRIDAGTGTTYTLTLADIPAGSAPANVSEADVRVVAKRDVGGSPRYARTGRSYRLTFAAGWGEAWGRNWGAPS